MSSIVELSVCSSKDYFEGELRVEVEDFLSIPLDGTGSLN